MTRAPRFDEAVPGRLIGQDPLDGTMVDVVFDWSPGREPRGMSGPPENYDPGEGEEFNIVSPPGLSAEHEEAVIEWLDANWERPVEDDGPDPDWVYDMQRDERMLQEAEAKLSEGKTNG